ncbi:MAG: thioredoxin-like domain-containing protein [Crocinitomicaceae bacterium]
MKNILTFLFLICASATYAQKIRLKVEDQKDTTVFLIKYFGSRLNYADTAQMKNGVVVFDGKKQKPGIVGLLLPGQKYFEFVFNNEEVQLETKGPDFMSNMKIIKSEENKIFIPYVKFISGKKGDANKLAEQRAKLKDTDEEYAKLSASIDAINKEVDDYQKELVALHGEKLVGKIVKMSMDVTVPETPKNEQGEIIDSNFRYKYYFEHYWDNVDFKTDALVNNPIFHNKLEFYFGKNMMIQHWDTIIKYAFKFCDGLDSKSKMFEYSVGWIATTFGKSQIMGMDKVYLYMLNRYFCTTDPATGKSPATWVAEDKFEELCKDLKWKLNLVVGAKPYNLILRDTSDTKWLDFYSLKSEYTVLYFWDPECGHCKKVTPKLVTLYNQKFKDRNIEVFAVGKGIGKDFESWKKYIRENNLNFINVAVTNSIYEIAKATPEKLVPLYVGEKGKPTTLESLNFQTTYDLYSTPRIFVLDKDKKIIAKNLSISQLEDLMDNLQGKKDLPKLFQEDKEEAEHMQQNN